MNVLDKIADYWKNWNGEDESITNVRLSTKDLRFITSLNVDKCKMESHNEHYKWHYLKDNPLVYPQYDDKCLVCYYDNETEQAEYELAWNPRGTSKWRNERGFVDNVLAWKYIERGNI